MIRLHWSTDIYLQRFRSLSLPYQRACIDYDFKIILWWHVSCNVAGAKASARGTSTRRSTRCSTRRARRCPAVSARASHPLDALDGRLTRRKRRQYHPPSASHPGHSVTWNTLAMAYCQYVNIALYCLVFGALAFAVVEMYVLFFFGSTIPNYYETELVSFMSKFLMKSNQIQYIIINYRLLKVIIFVTIIFLNHAKFICQ